jgi:hypothetical protein
MFTNFLIKWNYVGLAVVWWVGELTFSSKGAAIIPWYQVSYFNIFAFLMKAE